MTVIHTAIFAFVPDAPDDTAETLTDRLQHVAHLCSGLISFRCGADNGLAATNADFAVTAEFDDVDAFTAYLDSPGHQSVIASMSPLLASKSAVQFTTHRTDSERHR